MSARGVADLEAAGDVAGAWRAARAAQAAWAALDLHARAAVVGRTARLLAEEAAGVAAAIGAASDRPAAEVWSGEIVPTLDALRWLARRGVRHLRPRALARSRFQWYFLAARHDLSWEPFGIVGVVTPGNSWLFLAVPQIAAALLAGNGVLWKPAPAGSGTARRVASLFWLAGLPPELLQVVEGGAEAAREVVAAGVDKLFFTGGSEAGLDLYRHQAARGRPAVLELSGRHVAVVLAGADPALAARGIAWGKLSNGGRHCVSVQLVLVERAAMPAFLDATRAAMAAVRPEDFTSASGREASARLRALVADAVDGGARRLLGDGAGPTLLADVAPGMRVVEEEVQGPILAVAAVDSEEQAVAWINRSAHRLSASLWASDLARARRLARRLDVGQVWINESLHPVAQPEVSLAGRGASGFGASRGVR